MRRSTACFAALALVLAACGDDDDTAASDRDDFEVGTPRHPEHSLDDDAAVGVSWVRESRFPGPNWIEDFREHLRHTDA
jgi:hypothetical protein